MNHKHFTIEERESIFKFLAQKKSISFIAAKLKKNRVSIYREINRNSVDGEYTPNKAQFLYKKKTTLWKKAQIKRFDPFGRYSRKVRIRLESRTNIRKS
ncbi:helix-turn-helix domain-containing protein [Fusobacteria bacterium ZRK30]|nr:helix-turn-helix domain-containing protein [Fusobacteria bacterium ZRK30]